jgi:hypothetical protein
VVCLKASVCRAVREVVAAVNRILLPEWVRWPRNMTEVVRKFHDRGRMPLVCGCVDGTLIETDAPTDNEADFVDRHENHSINVMVVCGPDLCVFYVNARQRSRRPCSKKQQDVLKNGRRVATN